MFQKIKDLLLSQNIEFKILHHEPTLTSEASAKARGEDLSTGGKALVLKIDQSFKVLVISASKKINSKAIKKYFGAKKLRFANREELFELTGLEPGSVPPFGRPIINLDLYVDESITTNEKIAFNAGSLTDSIIMSTKDFLALAEPVVFSFSK